MGLPPTFLKQVMRFEEHYSGDWKMQAIQKGF